MLRLIVVLAIALCLSCHASILDERHAFPEYESDLYYEIHGDGTYSVSDEKLAEKRRNELIRNWETHGLQRMAYDTDRALSAIFRIAVLNLRKRGFKAEAREMEEEFKKFDGEVSRLVTKRNRKIGDFEPLSKWLAVAYFVLEEKLGYDICRALRISDLHTINFTVKVVFAPCAAGLEEFTWHFVHDDPSIFHPYRGLAPVVSYWVSVVSCSIMTYGAGYFFICSPIAMLIELGVDRYAAPWLAPRIFSMACGGAQ